jgi:hypothetical protein
LVEAVAIVVYQTTSSASVVILLDDRDPKTSFGKPCGAGNATSPGTCQLESVRVESQVTAYGILTYDNCALGFTHVSVVVFTESIREPGRGRGLQKITWLLSLWCAA